MANIIRDLNEHVDQVILEGEINKAFRPQVITIGQGLGGMIGAAVSQKIFNAGTGLLYDAKNSFTAHKTKKKASEKIKEVLDQFKYLVNGFFREINQAVPKVFFAAVKKTFPYSVWEKNEHEYSKLLNAFGEISDEEARRNLGVQILQADPTDISSYERCFTLLKSEDKLCEDVAVLSTVAEWFNVDIGKVKTEYIEKYIAKRFEYITNEYPATDLRRYDLIQQVEKETECSREKGDKYRSEYVRGLVHSLTAYDPKIVKPVVNKIKQFEKKYEYNATAEKDQLVETIIEDAHIQTQWSDLRSLDQFNEEIEKCDRMISLYPGLDIRSVRDAMRTKYSALNEAWKEARTVGNHVYATMEEAGKAREEQKAESEELKGIDDAYSKYGQNDIGEIRAFTAVLQLSVHTKAGKDKLAKKEEHLLKTYREKKDGIPPRKRKSTASIVVLLGLTGLNILIAVAATLSSSTMLPGLIYGFIGLLFLISACRESKESRVERKKYNAMLAEYQREFDQNLLLENGHIKLRK